jgi:hypothetical protein
MGQREFLNHLFVRVLSHWSLVQPFLEINMDLFKVCVLPRWPPGELALTIISVAFGMPLPSYFQRNFTFGVLMRFTSRLWHHRCTRVLNHFGHSQEIVDESISGNFHHSGCHPTGRDSILPINFRLSLGILHFLVCCPGR